jgi:hypothetical protein
MFTIALIFYKYTSNIVVSIALKKKGYRAEVRRERKKRDIPQPCECVLTNNISNSPI